MFFSLSRDLGLPGKNMSQIRVWVPFHSINGSNGMEQLLRLINKSGPFRRKSGGEYGILIGDSSGKAEMGSAGVGVKC